MTLTETIGFYAGRARVGWSELPRRTQVLVPAFFLMVVLSAVAWQRCLFMGCPDVHLLNSYQPGGAPVLLDRHGKRFGELAPVEREMVSLATLPKHVGEAFIAVEDQRFMKHHGIDLPRVVGAMLANVRAGKIDEGSSTITMQLARNVFPDRLSYRDRTFGRKIVEARVAQEIEREFDKNQILEMYVNHIYFGAGAHGIEAASRHYFGVKAKELTLPQAALLAGLPKAPTHYDPRRNPRQARERRDLVLSLMEQQKRATPEAVRAARLAPLGVVRRVRAAQTDDRAAYFVEEVRRQLEEKLGDMIYGEPLRVTTTLDLTAQDAAEEELERQLRVVESGGVGAFRGPVRSTLAEAHGEETPYLQGAVVAMDVREGDVLAWVGGRDFHDSRFDRVKSARRQAGSAFKPFVYATALEAGYSLTRALSDEPLRVRMDRRRVWEPKNFDGAYEGTVTMREALVRSKNVPTIRLATEIGYHNVASFAEKAGIEPPIPDQPSMALGTVAVSPLELTAAYTAFASMGEAVRPRVLLKVERADGRLLWAPEPSERHTVLEPSTAYMINDMLQEALLRGTGTAVRAAGFSGVAAGKTGTTNDGADAWFVGYTPEVVAAVWIGFDEMQPIVPKATGGRLAAPVWAHMMMRYYRGRDLPKPWAPPSDVIEVNVDPATGFALAPGCAPVEGAVRREIFRRSAAPVAVCPFNGPIVPLEAMMMAEPSDDEERMDPSYLQPVDPSLGGVQTAAQDGTATPQVEPARSYAPDMTSEPARSYGPTTPRSPAPGASAPPSTTTPVPAITVPPIGEAPRAAPPPTTPPASTPPATQAPAPAAGSGNDEGAGADRDDPPPSSAPPE